MSRSRNIKPGFFQNDTLAECDPLARILFAGLWCEADRSGRLLDRPKKIKAACLPYDDCDVNALLDQLAARGFIIRYVVETVAIIQVCEFSKHQNPHKKEAESALPPPEKMQAPYKHHASTVQEPEIPEPARLIPDSLNLIPDSIESSNDDSCPPPNGEGRSRFDGFWAAYPLKDGKKKAREVWQRKKLDRLADRIIADVVKRKAEHGQWLEGYVPLATTYLNGERWQDEIRPRQGPPSRPAEVSKTTQFFKEQIEAIHDHMATLGNQNGPVGAGLPQLGTYTAERGAGVRHGGECLGLGFDAGPSVGRGT